MTQYLPYGVKLSDNQNRKLAPAVGNKSAITIILNKRELSGPDKLMLTKTQINRIKKSMLNHDGVDMKILKAQIESESESEVKVKVNDSIP